MTIEEKSNQPSDDTRVETAAINPGDIAPAGTPGTGDNLCPDCSGSGRLGQRECQTCGGSGRVIEGVGGA